MARDPYADFRAPGRLDRAVRIVLLASLAALGGVIAGGVSVFAVVSVLTAPASHPVYRATVSDERAAVPAPQKVSPTSSHVASAPNAAPATSARAHTMAAVQTETATPTALPQRGSPQTASSDGRILESKPPQSGAGTRSPRPLYGYAPQSYGGESAKRWRNTAVRDRLSSAAVRAENRDRDDVDARRGGPAERDVSPDSREHGMAENADEGPPRGFKARRSIDRRWLNDRDQDYSRYRSPQPRRGYNGDDQTDSLIGNDEWVGDWHH